ncbi:MAG: hypothetical protein R6V72_07225 [Cyclobacterium sp.]|uniref:hypothetical protein n=1 Tax=unclassified Cyclobacterium TaxID=2615055 RepID=UPI0013D568F7|nr:hypothetical protein [Cyclobacterium sp. SYSU L10401]
MSSQNFISNILFQSALIGCLFCFLVVGKLYGQSEQDVEFVEPPKKEKAYHPSTTEKKIKRANRSTLSGYSSKEGGAAINERKKYKDHSEKSDWKNEDISEEVSTLSFNIFLYVLDRFKED